MTRTVAEPAAELLARGLAARREAGGRLYEREAARIAELCHAVAERCARGGRLLACACSPAGASDARHVAVEFVHPVIVGKRALPALALIGDAGRLPGEVALLARPDDIVLAFGDDGDAPALTAALAAARACGSLTVAFAPLGRDWVIEPPAADPYVRQELIETALPHALGARRTSSSSTAACSQGAQRAPRPRCRRVELPLPVPQRERDRPRGRARRRARLGAR